SGDAMPVTGEELRDHGLEQAGSGQPVSVTVSWEQQARYAILRLCLADANWSAEEVRQIAGDPPVPNMMGAAIRMAYLEGLIAPTGFDIATRPSRRASVLRLWRRA